MLNFDSAPDRVLSVTILNRLVRDALEAALPLTWVRGEISNLSCAASGHAYFSLKDAGAQVRCVMWRSRAQLLGWRLENGQQVEARVLSTFYEQRGEFQLNVETIRHGGQGDLYEHFLRLKARLEAEGLFDPVAKRPPPDHPEALAIVTSPQAAALRDVLSTLQRRAPHIRVDLYPTPVQGEGAAAKIAEAIGAASAGDCDAIILCRGGGSIEDLWAFNEEAVARAIRASRLPVISGVGHETDFTIADFAADLRAPTPTAAAELLSPDRSALLVALTNLQRRLERQTARGFAERLQQLDWLASRLLHPDERLRQQQARTTELTARLSRAAVVRLGIFTQKINGTAHRLNCARLRTAPARAALQHIEHQLGKAARQQIFSAEAKLNRLSASLTQLDPVAILQRGYTIVIDANGRTVRDASTLAFGDTLQLTFACGKALTTVDQVVAPPEAV